MPDFALDLGFDRIRLLSRRSVDWEFLGDVDTTAPDLTPRLKALIAQVNPSSDQRLNAWIFLPEDQVLFERVSLDKGGEENIARTVAAHLEGRTPYDVAELRADWDPHLDIIDVAAVAEETLREAGRFASAHGIEPVAITVRIDPSVFPRHPEFRELPTAAVFRSTRDPETSVEAAIAPQPVAQTANPTPHVPSPARRPPSKASLLAGGAVAATVVFGALLWSVFGGSEPVPDVEIAQAEPIVRPALVDDLNGVAMPQADADLATRPALDATAPGLPLSETAVVVSPTASAPVAPDQVPEPAAVSETQQPVTPPGTVVSAEVPRPPEQALEPANPVEAPALDTASAEQSFPLRSGAVQAEVDDVPPLDTTRTELNLASIPREFIVPPGQWPEAGAFDRQSNDAPTFDPGLEPTAVAPATQAPATAAPAGETTAPTEPTRAENDAIQGPDELAPALAPPALPPETDLAAEIGEERESLAPQEATLRPLGRPEAPEVPDVIEEVEPDPVLAVAASPRPQDRPAPRVRQQQAVAAASTAAVVPRQQSSSQSGSAGVESLVVTPRQPQGGAPTAGRVARAATQSNAIAMGRVNLIGVFGSDGARRAIVRLPNGRMKRVKVGDRIDGGRVAAIGRSQLSYVKGGRTIQLAIPSG